MHHRQVCLLILALASYASASKLCWLPYGRTGICTPLKACDPLLELIKIRHKTSFVLQYIYQSVTNCSIGLTSEILCCCPPKRKKTTKKNPCCMDRKKTTIENRFSVHKFQCGQDNSIQDKIIGGSVADIDQFPWLVLLESKNNMTVCGGSLISIRYVLTAAHCLIGWFEPKFARLAEYNTTSGPTDFVNEYQVTVDRVPIVKNIAHSYYTRLHNSNDIGLSKLSRDAVLSIFISPICLPNQDLIKSMQEPMYFTVAGWGSDGYRPSEVKKYVTVPFIPSDGCRQMYWDRYQYMPKLDRQICAGGIENEDSCSGDSGGPLMYNRHNTFFVVGIVSYGPIHCGRKNIPSVHTYVYPYLDWLRENMV